MYRFNIVKIVDDIQVHTYTIDNCLFKQFLGFYEMYMCTRSMCLVTFIYCTCSDWFQVLLT